MMTEEQHRRHLTGNVRGDLVGHEGAEELDIEDNRTTALATLVLGGILIVVAIATLTQAASLSNNGNAVGPATAPWVIGSLMLIVSVSLILRGRSELAAARAEHTPGHQTSPQDWKRLGLLLARADRVRGGEPVPRVRRLRDAALRDHRHLARRPEQGEGVRLRVHRRLGRVPALRRADRASPCRPASGGSEHGLLLPADDGVQRGADPDQPVPGPDRGHPRHPGRRAPRHRARADRRAAAADHVHPGADRRADPVRGHLLRRHVRRVDDRDPAEHTGRERVDGGRPRGQQDGAQRGELRPRSRPPRSAPSSRARSPRSC